MGFSMLGLELEIILTKEWDRNVYGQDICKISFKTKLRLLVKAD